MHGFTHVKATSTQGRHSPAPATTIIISPVGRGRFDAHLEGGALLVAASHQPFLDGCRALLAAGVDPSTIAIMRHAGSATDALRATVGVAAGLTVEDDRFGRPRFVRWRGPQCDGAAPPMRFSASPRARQRATPARAAVALSMEAAS